MAAGLLKYTVAESNNLLLGGNGIEELTSAGSSASGNFIAFYVTGAAATDKCTVAATCHIGDNLTATPVLQGTLVYGPFRQITMSSPTDADVHVLCYYG